MEHGVVFTILLGWRAVGSILVTGKGFGPELNIQSDASVTGGQLLRHGFQTELDISDVVHVVVDVEIGTAGGQLGGVLTFLEPLDGFCRKYRRTFAFRNMPFVEDGVRLYWFVCLCIHCNPGSGGPTDRTLRVMDKEVAQGDQSLVAGRPGHYSRWIAIAGQPVHHDMQTGKHPETAMLFQVVIAEAKCVRVAGCDVLQMVADGSDGYATVSVQLVGTGTVRVFECEGY